MFHVFFNSSCFSVPALSQAKLPRGIHQVRPHLKNIDNVPLLVPLFTDCTPDSESSLCVLYIKSPSLCVIALSFVHLFVLLFHGVLYPPCLHLPLKTEADSNEEKS